MKRRYKMIFSVSSTLLDALVLEVVSRNDTYGYEITQSIRNIRVETEDITR